jgi:hypothetical protein
MAMLLNHLHITCASLFDVCASIVGLSTHIVHCVWASCFLFICYPQEHCWMIYIEHAPLCLLLSRLRLDHLQKLCIVFVKDNFLCLHKSLHLKKLVDGCELGGGLILWSLGLLLDLNPMARPMLCRWTSLDSNMNLGMNTKIEMKKLQCFTSIQVLLAHIKN